MNFKSFSLYIPGIVALVVFVGGFVAVNAFTSPTQVPPGGNVPAPLNTGPTGQEKAGGLILNTGGAPNGLLVPFGNVGIGTVNPSEKLSVNGIIRTLTGGIKFPDNTIQTTASPLVLLDTKSLAGLNETTFSNIPYYPFYRMVFSGHLSFGVGNLAVRFNNDSTLSYGTNDVFGCGSCLANYATVGSLSFQRSRAAWVYDILISNTVGQHKTAVGTGGIDGSGTTVSGSWFKEEVIQNITMLSMTRSGFVGPFDTGAIVKLYGLQ